MVNIVFFTVLYIILGRIFGYPIYKNDFFELLIDKKIIKYDCEYEKNIRPKWFRNILRIISILIWPLSLMIYSIIIIIVIIKVIITSFIKFFTE